MFYHLNFTADVSIEAWQTADDMTEITDEIQDTAEPVLEDAITVNTNDEDLENTDVAIASATVEISDEKLEERKPEEELFVLVDDDLDNDIISSHAAAFHRVDPQLEQPTTAATSQPGTPGKTSAAEGDAAKKKTTTEKTDVTYNASSEDAAAVTTKTSEKTTPKRLVFGAEWVLHQSSHDCECIHRYQPVQTTTLMHRFQPAGRYGVAVAYARTFPSARFPDTIVINRHLSPVVTVHCHTSS